MKWFDRVTVLKKLLLAFAVVIGFGVVDSGATLARRVRPTMAEATRAVQRVTDIMGEIPAASNR